MFYLTMLFLAKFIWRWWYMDEWVWTIAGTLLTGENWRTRIKSSPCVTLSTTNSSWTRLMLILGLLGERPRTNRRSRGRFLFTFFPPSGTSENCEKRLLALTYLPVLLSVLPFAWNILWKNVGKIRVSLNYDNHDGYCAWKRMYIYNISLNSS